MAESRQAIKNRIRSVESTEKITRVMQLIASTELTRQRKHMEENREYAKGLSELLDFAIQSSQDRSIYLKEEVDKPTFLFVFTSDMGLCGSYNANILRLLNQTITDKDYLVMVGSKGCTWANGRNISCANQLMDLNHDIAYDSLSAIANTALMKFENGDIGKIQVLYTHFKNTLTYIPTLETVLPVAKKEKEKEEVASKAKQITDYEPGQEQMLGMVIPMAIKSLVYSRYLESKTSEQANRRMAMEAATDNADELRDELMLVYNQARQSAITNEIIDIVGGANALS